MSENNRKLRFTVNVEPARHLSKPRNVGQVRNITCCPDAVQLVTGERLCRYIAEGRTFTAGCLFGRSADTWQDQRLLVIDIDNEEKDPETGKPVPCKYPLRVKGILKILADHGLQHAAIYETFSSTPEHPRYRVILLLDQTIDDPDLAERLNRKAAAIFPGADPKCCDLARLFFGTSGIDKFQHYSDGSVWTGNSVSVEQIEALPDPAPDPEEGEQHSAAAQSSGRTLPNGKRVPVPGTEKGGAIGAWCRVFDCFNVMDQLCDMGLYAPSNDPHRFLYHGSSSGIAGLVISDDGQTAFCFSSSDPAGAGGHQLNSFDLYRIAVYGLK